VADLQLNQASQSFLDALVSRHPELSEFATTGGTDEGPTGSLVVDVPSPTGDPERRLYIWMEDSTEPSVGFGPWHTHERVWAADGQIVGHSGSLIDLISSIIEDRFVIFEEVGGEHDGFSSVLDLRSRDALEDYFTERYSAERIRIKSWSGTIDREVAVSDL